MGLESPEFRLISSFRAEPGPSQSCVALKCYSISLCKALLFFKPPISSCKMRRRQEGVGDAIAQIIFTMSLAVVGGVFNHMRGSDGGMLHAASFSGAFQVGLFLNS